MPTARQCVHKCSDTGHGFESFKIKYFFLCPQPSTAAVCQSVHSLLSWAHNKSYLRFTCTSLPQPNSFSKISLFPFLAALCQAVSPSTSFVSNRSSLRFTCTSLPQTHSFSKISLLPFHVAMSQAVSPLKEKMKEICY